jgi:hypothetical protein
MNPKAKTWLVWMAAAAVVGAAFLYRQRKDAEAEARREAKRAAVVNTVRALADRHGADSRWIYELVKGHKDFIRISDVRTIELERLWVTPRPIVFTGWVADIASGGWGGRPVVTVKYDEELNPRYAIMTRLLLRLEVRDAARLVELERLAADEDFQFFGSVAFVAQIDRVESAAWPVEDGEYETAMVGVGTLVDFSVMRDVR